MYICVGLADVHVDMNASREIKAGSRGQLSLSNSSKLEGHFKDSAPLHGCDGR